ncbi:hypothetical protein HanPI659440_Chr15g0575811 [Helianthus annuus]|nr:hypothetical protein HanPI659440_Chr15g0575811 [Helianthus annuus]
MSFVYGSRPVSFLVDLYCGCVILTQFNTPEENLGRRSCYRHCQYTTLGKFPLTRFLNYFKCLHFVSKDV